MYINSEYREILMKNLCKTDVLYSISLWIEMSNYFF